jgi:hypothetical protein
MSRMKDKKDYYCKSCRLNFVTHTHRNNKRKCELDGCDSPHYAKGFCKVHRTRLYYADRIEKVNRNIHLSEKALRSRSRLYNVDVSWLIENGKACNICNAVREDALHVDHDHNCCPKSGSCGKCVRGMICSKCNAAVQRYEDGILRDNYPNAEKIRQYVLRYGKIDKSR